MGTNYYIAVDGKVPSDNDAEQAVHIGKSSLGWRFHFQGHTCKTVAAWRERLDNLAPNETIQDEYGRDVPVTEFWKLVAAKNTPEALTARKYALQHSIGNVQRDFVADDFLRGVMWEDEDHGFSDRVFS